MNHFIKSKTRAQASIEFSLGLVTAVLFLFLTCNLFVWYGRTVVQRQIAYENSRTKAASNTNPGQLDFYTPKKMNLFKSGGID
ncbi:MAG: hypothetical protein NTW64_01980 [Candidatus Omnitrophica bacterium]|nr:hypothetical protein [Candidatus Omnitrophota bacterium]